VADLPDFLVELEELGQGIYAVQQTHIPKVSVIVLDSLGREQRARKEACHERCWFVIGDRGVALYDGEEECLMEEVHLA
jgi:hypothetical protein